MKARTRALLALIVFAALLPGMLHADPLDAVLGKALFDRQWIPAPASTNASDGLGPLFTSRSCAGCHARGDGAHIVTRDDGNADIAGAVVRFGKADGTTDPFYGLELQTNAVPGLTPEGQVRFLPDLKYNLKGPALGEDVHAGARLAPPLFGKGAFDDVPDEAILMRAAANAHNGDGVKGRANVTPRGIGRYGWKAGQVTIEEQVAHAFAFDIGLSSPKQPLPYGDCTKLETDCLALPNGESPLFEGHEISSVMLGVVATYLKTLRARPLSRVSAGFRGGRLRCLPFTNFNDTRRPANSGLHRSPASRYGSSARRRRRGAGRQVVGVANRAADRWSLASGAAALSS